MSQKLFIANNNHNNNAKGCKKPPYTKKGVGPMNIIKVALYMLKGKKGGGKRKNTASALPEATNATLSRLVGSVRPLHLQQGVGGYSPPPLPPSSTPLLLPPPSPEWGEAAGVVVSPCLYEGGPLRSQSRSSFSSLSSSSSSTSGGMSRYASAQSLYDLDNHDEDEEEKEINVKDEENDGDAYYDGLEGDDMIDSKAEMFIAKFYQQMRLQNSN